MNTTTATTGTQIGTPVGARRPTRFRRLAFGLAATSIVAGAAWTALPADAHGRFARAHLLLADGTHVGIVNLFDQGATTRVQVTLRLPAGVGPVDAFHGFHIHANSDPANGAGCVPDADPSKAFVSADGHWKADGQNHAGHNGDLTSLYAAPNGTVSAVFHTGRLEPEDVIGKAVIFHLGADNFGNVPVGAAANQYAANDPAATTLTQNTGNAGNRLACGVIEAW